MSGRPVGHFLPARAFGLARRGIKDTKIQIAEFWRLLIKNLAHQALLILILSHLLKRLVTP
jgi:hypothetical protein